jgi:biopolymer transport protein ExbB/TolQ
MDSNKKLWQKVSIRLNSNKTFELIFVACSGILIFCFFYLIAIPVFKLFDSSGPNYVVEIFVKRGPIPYIIVIFFGLCIGLLLKHIFVLSFENYAFGIFREELKENQELPTKCIYADSLTFLKIVNDERLEIFKNTRIYKRISQSMQLLFNTQDTNAMSDYFKQRSDIEYSEMESGFSTIKYFNWLIPTLGFIGTVLGIGVGISGFAQIIINADNFSQIKEYLPGVTHSLGVAFDTTFLALIISVVLMFFTSYVNKSYENLIESLDIFCLDEISSRFKLHSTVAEQLKEVMREIKNDIENIVQGNRIEIINTLDISLKQLVGGIGLINNTIENGKNSIDLSPVVILLQNVIKALKGIDNKESLDNIQREIIRLNELIKFRKDNNNDTNFNERSGK